MQAFSGYAFVRAGLNLSVRPTMKKYKSAYLSFCDKRGSQNHEESRVLSRRTPLCFAGHYIYVLLTHGYGFSSDTWDIAFEDTVSVAMCNSHIRSQPTSLVVAM